MRRNYSAPMSETWMNRGSESAFFERKQTNGLRVFCGLVDSIVYPHRDRKREGEKEREIRISHGASSDGCSGYLVGWLQCRPMGPASRSRNEEGEHPRHHDENRFHRSIPPTTLTAAGQCGRRGAFLFLHPSQGAV